MIVMLKNYSATLNKKHKIHLFQKTRPTMKYTLFYILFIATLSICNAQSSLVKIEADTTSIRIGEQFQLKITVNETENVIIPKLGNLYGLEIIDSLKTDTLKNTILKKYVLTGFDSGAFYIPKQQIFIKNQAYETDSLLINVATVKIDTSKVKKFPIKGIKGEPYQFDDYKNIVLVVLLLLAIVLTTLYFALKRSNDDRVKTFVPKLAPYQEALRNLKLLDDKLLWQNNKIKPYYSELTTIIRNYIERELHVPALEQTTNQIIESLNDFSDAKVILTEKDTIKKLKRLFEQADLVKFAKAKPLAEDITSDRKIAETIIKNMQPILAEENSEVSYSTPVVIVQKPEVEKPKNLVKVILIALAAILIFMLSIGIGKVILMSNTSKNPTENVQ